MGRDYTLLSFVLSMRLNQSPSARIAKLPITPMPISSAPNINKCQPRQVLIPCPTAKPNALNPKYNNKRQPLPPRRMWNSAPHSKAINRAKSVRGMVMGGKDEG